MKLQKIFLLVFSSICLVLTVLFLYSCNKEKQPLEQDLVETNADKLVASKEFQNYQGTLEKFAYNYQNKYQNLSESKKQRLKDTFAKLSENNTEKILNEASSIIGMNLLANAKTINKKSEFLKEIGRTNITKKELTIAITKHNLTERNGLIRLKSGSESSDGRSKCKKACDASFIACAAAAALTPPPADLALLALCIYAYDQCIGACNE